MGRVEELPLPRPDALGTYGSVIWAIEVVDPEKSVAADSVSEQTSGLAEQVAASFACDFICCADDDEIDGVPYYKWLFRVPRVENRRQTADGVPLVVSEVCSVLQSVMPELDRWECHADNFLSYEEAVSTYIRTSYADLLDVIDVRLLPLRRDGAESIEPDARHAGHLDDGSLIAGYTIFLCSDGHAKYPRWITIRVGFVPSALPGEPVGRARVTADLPVLLAPRPRPHRTWTWMACLSLGAFTGDPDNPSIIATQPSEGSRYQWQSGDPDRLADMIERDLRMLLPQLWRPGQDVT